MAGLLTKLKNKYVDLRGFHTNRKLVIIESDDWGSIRMPSKETFEYLQSLGDHPERDGFLSNDCLENEEDLRALFEVLSSVQDGKGHYPIMTANFAMANPNFDKIDYENGVYAYEPFYETYQKYYGDNNILETVREGYQRKLMLPQLHCREHLNVARWMRDLKNNVDHTKLAFECKTMGIGASFCPLNRFGYMDSFNTDCATERELDEILDDAHRIFIDVFGYKSKTFVASCNVWANSLGKSLKKQEIGYIQSAVWQYEPIGKAGTFELQRRVCYTGQKNQHGQIYGVRNCNYEPAYYQNPQECMLTCLNKVEQAFKAKKPAIICSHRFNYIGSINPKNRENNLVWLKKMLDTIVQTHPDVEFISSAELCEIISQK